MLTIKTLSMLHQTIREWRLAKDRIALVPTMGHLHEGHMLLIKVARTHADKVVVSIFVNPMQFSHSEDLKTYPRTLREDFEKLIQRNVDMVFVPSNKVIYPNDLSVQTFVDVPCFSNILEGKHRPGHFRGVATIVSKLFNLVQPDVACFGEKDFQQLLIVRQLVKDMGYNIDIIGVPTVRDADGLALSSRNSHLSPEERRIAPRLNHILKKIAEEFNFKKCNIEELLVSAKKELLQTGFIPETLMICDAENLKPLTLNSRRAVILFTVWLGKTRLIDNVQVELTKKY